MVEGVEQEQFTQLNTEKQLLATAEAQQKAIPATSYVPLDSCAANAMGKLLMLKLFPFNCKRLIR